MRNKLTHPSGVRKFLSASRDSGRFGKILPRQEADALRKIERSIAYMNEHIDKPLQVATLATLVNVSPSHFYMLFKQFTGSSPIDYFIRLRMLRASRMLGSTTARIKEVAAALGYDDPFYFSRVFRSATGVAPTAFRMLKNGEREAVTNRSSFLRRPSTLRTSRNGDAGAREGISN